MAHYRSNVLSAFENIDPDGCRSYMVSPSRLENLASSCPGLCHERSPPSQTSLVLFKPATRSELHRLVFCGNGGESIITQDSLPLDQLLATGLFIELAGL